MAGIMVGAGQGVWLRRRRIRKRRRYTPISKDPLLATRELKRGSLSKTTSEHRKLKGRRGVMLAFLGLKGRKPGSIKSPSTGKVTHNPEEREREGGMTTGTSKETNKEWRDKGRRD